MLQNDLYEIKEVMPVDDGVAYALSVNADSVIYKAHFPYKPILPGVCLLQMAQELLAHHLQRRLFVDHIAQMKFLSVITPDMSDIICTLQHIVGRDDGFDAKAAFSYEGRVCAKISLSLQRH